MSHQVISLEPQSYQRHIVHTRDRQWAETNCYVDVLIELLHALKHEPIAAFPFTLGIDFEGDQWTFFKFPHADLYDLYGLDIQELAMWRPLTDHLEEQLALGRPVLVELDSFHLPDTVGTAYKLAHTKSTVAAMEIDVAERRLGYFHGQGYYHLHGDDFDHVFRRLAPHNPDVLPPYVEIVKSRNIAPKSTPELLEISLGLLRKQLARLPEENPFEKFKAKLVADLQWLSGSPLELFHQYSFATLRQFGACYELAATYLEWLSNHGVTELEEARQAFSNLSSSAKTVQFQLARTMARKKQLDMAPLDAMAQTWTTGMALLTTRFAG